MRLFFPTKHSEYCYTKEELVKKGFKGGFLAKPEKVSGFFWCSSFGEITEKGECGKQCEFYEPCNGTTGRCKHFSYARENTKKYISFRGVK